MCHTMFCYRMEMNVFVMFLLRRHMTHTLARQNPHKAQTNVNESLRNTVLKDRCVHDTNISSHDERELVTLRP